MLTYTVIQLIKVEDVGIVDTMQPDNTQDSVDSVANRVISETSLSLSTGISVTDVRTITETKVTSANCCYWVGMFSSSTLFGHRSEHFVATRATDTPP